MELLSATYDAVHGHLKKVTWDEAFKEETALLQADVLKDLLVAVEDRYQEALVELHADLLDRAEKTTPTSSEPVQLSFDFDTQAE